MTLRLGRPAFESRVEKGVATMRRQLLLLVAGLAGALPFLLPPRVRPTQIMSVHAQSPPLTATPAATATLTATAASPTLSNVLLLQSSYERMNSVRRIHAAGFGQDGTGSTTSQVRFTGDCDAGGKTLRLRIRLRTTDENQRPRTVVIILAGKNAWQRSRTGKNGRWSRWKVRKGESAYLLFLLGPLLCPIGSAAGTTAQRDLGSLPVQHLGTAMVHDLPTWHLRLQSEQTGEQVTQDWYVDQRTRYWDRFVVTDVNQRNQGAQDSSITDIEYSRFNLPVKIRPPRA